MKKTSQMFLMLLAVLFYSCQQVADDSMESKVRLKIKATTVKQSVVKGWESAGDGVIDVNGLPSRATTEAAKRMVFALIDQTGDIALLQEKGNDDESYMSLDVEVSVGDYQLVAFAHNGTEDVTIDPSGTITPPNSKPTDSFLYYKELTIDEYSENNLSITLNRCVAKFTLKHTDIIPDNAASVRFETANSGNVLNFKTGLANNTNGQTVTVNIPSSNIGTSNNSISFYTFLGTTIDLVDVTATSVDTNGDVITSYVFDDVDMEINMQTIYTGVFFHSDQTIEATINSEWKTSNEVSF